MDALGALACLLAAHLRWHEGGETLRRGEAVFVLREGRIARRHTFIYQA